MARKGENIRKRADGRWEGRYILPCATGRGKMRSVYANSYAEARTKLARARLDAFGTAENGETVAAEEPLDYYARMWLSRVARERKHATYVKYRMIYEKHLAAGFGSLSLSEICDALIREKLNREEMSDSIRKSIYVVLQQILDCAAAESGGSSIRFRKTLSGRGACTVEILNPTEQTRLIRYLIGHMNRRYLGIYICLSTGLRLGEICALRWECVDLEQKILYVKSTVQRIAVEGKASRTALVEGEPKTPCSKRAVPLSDPMVELLTRYARESGYVLKDDCPMEPRTYENIFKSCLKKAGIDEKKFHILRHSFATNCINSGMDTKSLSEILGHSNVSITLNRYVHPSFTTKRAHMNALSASYEFSADAAHPNYGS